MAPPRMSREGRRAARAAAKRARAMRSDAMYNTLTGQGGATDPVVWTQFCADIPTDEEARSLWLGNDFAAKVVELKPRAALRAGFRVVTDDKERDDELMHYLRELKTGTKIMEGAFRARAFGGGALVPIINDGSKDLGQPLRRNGRITSIARFQVLEALELYPISYYRSLFDEKFREPQRYRLQSVAARGTVAEAGMSIHESRMIVMKGIEVGAAQFLNPTNGWSSFSVLTRCAHVIRQFGASWQGVETLMHRLEQGILKMTELGDMIGEDGETGAVYTALTELGRLRSMFGMMVIDAKDDYTRVQAPIAGVADILKMLMVRLGAACETPLTKLFGRSPEGMNATGKSDDDNWTDVVDEYRELELEDTVEQVVELCMLANDGPLGGKLPDEWSIAWAPLQQPNQKEIAETNYVQAQADEKNISSGLYTPAIARRNRYGSDRGEICLTTSISEKEMRELEELDAAAAEAEQAALEASAAATEVPAPGAAAEEPKPTAKPSEDRADFDRAPVARRQFAGFDVAVENPAGSERAWAGGMTTMLHDYGRIEGTTGADGDGVDCYLGPDEAAPMVHVVHQQNPATGEYDEDKAMIGWASADAARDAYLAHRDDGSAAYGGMSVVPVEKFRAKLARRGRPGKVTHADRRPR